MGLNWLLLRGLVREQRHWGDFPAQLAAASGGNVQTLDLPGVGTERNRPAPTSISATVDDLRARLDRGQQQWGIFAPSLGGMVALDWASRWPEDFVRVAVCNTSARDLAGPFERFSFASIRATLRAVASTTRLARERHVLGLVSNTEVGRSQAEIFAGFEPAIGVNVLLRQLWAGSRAVAPASLSMPCLVLCSKGDRLCSPIASYRLAERLGARLAEHPTAGHDLPLDDPEWVCEQIAAFGE